MENDLIDWLRRRVPAHPQVPLGIGDDAALVQAAANGQMVVAVDALADGVHFRLGEHEPRRIGRKALAVNLSDMAAMAAEPVAAFVGLVLPRREGLRFATEVCEGMLDLAAKYNVAIAGGDTNTSDGPLVVCVTVLGIPGAKGVWRRAGAKAGDALIATGEFGGSRLGRHLDFEPRVKEALALAARYEIHAAMDVSDGLSLDLDRMARASSCGAELDLKVIPISAAAQALARSDGVSALDHALADGEDFELLLAVPPAEAERLLAERPLDIPLTRIGRFVAETGLWSTGDGHGRRVLEPRGYIHGAKP